MITQRRNDIINSVENPWISYEDHLYREHMLTENLRRNLPVSYDNKTHTYSFNNERYISATQLVHKFVPVFDVEERSAYMAYRYGKTQEYWKQKWADKRDGSCDRGNFIHKREEDFLYGHGFTSVNGKVYNVKKARTAQHVNYAELPDGTYPEMLLWRHDYHIAGRADKPTLDTVLGKRYSYIEDYKTNESINREGFDKNDMLLGPVSHLANCEFNIYSLQLSIYQFMLKYWGFIPAGQRLIHYPHPIEGLGTPSPVPIDLPYLEDEVIAMITEYHKQIDK